MSKYKIICNDIDSIRREHNGVAFKGVGYTDDPEIASDFKYDGMHTGGIPRFEVYEVDDDESGE